MGERLHYHAGREVDSETEKLLEQQTPEDEHKHQRTRECNDIASQDNSPKGAVASPSTSEYNSTRTSALADQQKDKKKLSFGFLRDFYRRPSDGNVERVTLFAVVLLIVLLAVYVLNQADRLVLPVVIPNGLRCNVGKDECASPNATNTSTGNDTIYNGTEDCIQFDDNQQGLLTGIHVVVLIRSHVRLYLCVHCGLISTFFLPYQSVLSLHAQVQRLRSSMCWQACL